MFRWTFIKKKKTPFDVGYKAPAGTKGVIQESTSSLFKRGWHDVSPSALNLVGKVK